MHHTYSLILPLSQEVMDAMSVDPGVALPPAPVTHRRTAFLDKLKKDSAPKEAQALSESESEEAVVSTL
jgi:hypothetical protein